VKYFDKKNNRLIFMGEKASPYYWDNQWDVENFKKVIENGKRNRLVTKTTTKFIPPDKSKKILEGGCGNGQFVYAFNELGYDSYGVDYAPKTVSRIKKIFPDLKVSVGDVRKLKFPDNHFDGYWSIGVIEHFFEGYSPIIKEIERIVRPGGFLFISFPHLSFLRKIKNKLGYYPPFDEKILNEKEFYQFALNHKEVINKITSQGFNLVKKIPYSGTKGLKDEISILKPLMQKIYDSNNILLKIINYGLSLALSRLRLSDHSILLVFCKK